MRQEIPKVRNNRHFLVHILLWSEQFYENPREDIIQECYVTLVFLSNIIKFKFTAEKKIN